VNVKRMGTHVLLAAGLWMGVMLCPADGNPAERDVQRLDDLIVTERAGAPGLTLSPTETVIEVESFPTIGPAGNVVELLKTQAIIDFRGDSELDPGVDSLFMRGFDGTRFVTAIDGLTVQKTGGRRSSNVVDYALLPTFLVKKVEILPGPHSALYDSKSIGGVINLVSAPPVHRDSLVPAASVNVSYESYNTQNYDAMVRGGVQALTYDLGYRKYLTDGYLRNTETDIDNYYSRLGLVLPGNGFVTLSASYAEVERQTTFRNSPSRANYDPRYPIVDPEGSMLHEWDWEEPTWNGFAAAYRLGYAQDLPIVRLQLGAYHSKENRDRSAWTDETQTIRSHQNTDWWQRGFKLQDAIAWSGRHTTTVGFDLAQMFDSAGADGAKMERIRRTGSFLQHQWGLLPPLDLRLGLRHETVRIWVTNSGANSVPNREPVVMRRWDEMIPKSFLTYRMGHLAPWLRDTFLSAGVSKIWRAPDVHGDYNPQGRPAGVWLENEHGMGYDLVLNRRLWRDIGLRINYAFYEIEDYIAGNQSYARFSGAGAGDLRFSDYKINLEKVQRHGVDFEVGGHLTNALSFYLSYAWQKFYNKGDEPAGETELHRRAEHRVSAGLRYALLERTTLMMDYCYQSREITEVSEQVSEDEWFFRQDENPGYNVFDLGIEQLLLRRAGPLQELKLRVYVKNLFDEKYYTPGLYPALDRTFGVTLSVRM
jgi:outer membrane receptor protein involved in Fe transport